MTNTQTLNTAIAITLGDIDVAATLASAAAFGLTADVAVASTNKFIFAGPDDALDAFIATNGLGLASGPFAAFIEAWDALTVDQAEDAWAEVDEPCEFGHVVGVKGCPACQPKSDMDDGW